MSGVNWESSPGDMAKRVEAYGKRLLQAVYELAVKWTQQLVNEMKETHPWKNRTGAAEKNLFGRVVRVAMGAVLILGHGVTYGIYLERKNAGRYAIVHPTLQRNYAAIMASLQQLVR